MVDGVSSVDLLNVLLKPMPIEHFEPAPRRILRPVPSGWDLGRDVLLRYAGLPLEIGRHLPRFLQEARDPRSDVRTRLRSLRDMLRSMRRVSDTPLNERIGPHRRFDWLAMQLDDVKGVKNRLGGTLNDVVLATVAGALRCFLQRRGVRVETLDFRVMAPVSVRAEQEHGTLGNRVSAWMVPMPLAERDPVRRLDKIRETTTRLKQSKQALGAEMLSQVAEWSPSTLLSMGARMATRLLPFNLVVTNVPGPQVPLYLLGARMLDNYGLVPLTDYLCLGIVLFSYAGQLCWGFTADWDRLPDLHEFLADIEAAFRELRDAPQRIELQQRPPHPARAKRERRKGAATLGRA
jgi:diacylglycerol O-acyltransferase